MRVAASVGSRLRHRVAFPMFLLALLAAGAAGAQERAWAPVACSLEDAASREEAALLRCFEPAFVVEDGHRSFNRIGTPTLFRAGGREKARIDTDTPAAFAEVRRDAIGGTEVMHLVYRVHFDRLAFKPSVFFERHRNVGVLAIVTVRAEDLAPLLLTTVYTCGCYRVVLPTSLLPEAALPPRRGRTRSAGHDLPDRLAAPVRGASRFVIHLTSKAHRLAGVETSASDAAPGIELPLREMKDLRRLPIQGAPGETGSFFYTRGLRRGHVRGAWSPIEGVTAGLLLLDPMLGMDKELGDPESTGTRFYTSLLPWQRNVSRLDRFDPLLRMLKFRPEQFGSVPGR